MGGLRRRPVTDGAAVRVHAAGRRRRQRRARRSRRHRHDRFSRSRLDRSRLDRSRHELDRSGVGGDDDDAAAEHRRDRHLGQGVWRRSPSDVYAVGWGHQVFYTTGDGTWTDLTSKFCSGAFSSVWGDASDLFIAGLPIFRSHAGGAWSVDQSSGTMTWDLRGLWGNASDYVWAVGSGGLLLHRDGTGWSVLSSGTKSDRFAVWGSDASHVWIGGANLFGRLR